MSVPTLMPVEDRIIENLQTTLAAISTSSLAADFYTNVMRVFVMDQAPGATIVDQPAVVIVHLGTTREQYCQDLDLCILSAELYLVMNRGQNWRKDLQKFSADVRKALLLDRNRGSLNTGQPNQMVNAFDTDVSDADVGNFLDGHNVAISRLVVKVTYRDSIFDPTQSG